MFSLIAPAVVRIVVFQYEFRGGQKSSKIKLVFLGII